MTVTKAIHVDAETLEAIMKSCRDDLPIDWYADSRDYISWNKKNFAVIRYNFHVELLPAYKKKIENLISLGCVANKKDVIAIQKAVALYNNEKIIDRLVIEAK